ncbi:predicted protein [Uncinocarpus reesii 1704]|uniref:Ecp2 effector protein domain-containing protein n=1 Tax=Uncinocarpus reesii (strain UAMH 1704) TaxID=336963 RepID=C4JWV7_UNCRE|nr:uncharacterized protein UREG_06130 [Uncinocarpus reesii 1704]EEP81265.1 predicted protein [Uncinocarpus reesii 1704]
MKSYAILALCLATVSAVDLIQIRIRTNADKEVGLLADLDELARTHPSASRGIGASITDKNVYCQAFSDPHGRDELGDPFSAGNDVAFTSSKDEKPVQIGSVLCSNSVDKLEGPGQKPLANEKGGDTTEKTVRVQFRTQFVEFTRGDVKLGETVQLGSDSKLGTTVEEAMVVSATGDVDWTAVRCQLFKDPEGKEKLGDAFTTYGETYGTEPAEVGAIRCDV